MVLNVSLKGSFGVLANSSIQGRDENQLIVRASLIVVDDNSRNQLYYGKQSKRFTMENYESSIIRNNFSRDPPNI
ncbi:hypothetical protein TNCV_4828231 [Trichonephila clavipes]|uniref:Uncharacterized protein n=1 Tax=Trichonephila clavipes TaxID=2585209 RepID=A0A8X6SN46_TRICX|nr:hypothetical protein TNCV_4828231 [Trichonephila clavipes]